MIYMTHQGWRGIYKEKSIIELDRWLYCRGYG